LWEEGSGQCAERGGEHGGGRTNTGAVGSDYYLKREIDLKYILVSLENAR
jgi:hypothetical protein